MDKAIFQGSKQTKDYFEGWYFKQVTKDQKVTLSVIPGISLDEEDPHCFIQVIESIHQRSYYIRYPLEAFSYPAGMYAKIGNSTFSSRGIHLDIHDKDLKLTGDLSFSEFRKWTPSLYAPTVMGPFSYFKKMECNHEIVSFYHTLTGTLRLEKKKIDFEEGSGYIEKDFGTSFPKEYLWLESHHPKGKERATFFLSIAHIPLKITSFEGIIGALVTEKEEYHFASYYGCKKISEKKTEQGIELILRQGKFTVVVEWKTEAGLTLKAPKKGRMKEHIKEAVTGNFDLVIYEKKRKIYRESFGCAGIEYVRPSEKK